jgi:hypothetical protein
LELFAYSLRGAAVIAVHEPMLEKISLRNASGKLVSGSFEVVKE